MIRLSPAPLRQAAIPSQSRGTEKRAEIRVDEDNLVDVGAFRGDESVEVGMDAVPQAIEKDK